MQVADIREWDGGPPNHADKNSVLRVQHTCFWGLCPECAAAVPDLQTQPATQNDKSRHTGAGRGKKEAVLTSLHWGRDKSLAP